MKKNIYFAKVVKRKSERKLWMLSWFIVATDLFKIPIEVIIRKNFGERHFSKFASIMIAVLLLLAPYYACRRYGSINTDLLLTSFSTWYLFTFVFIYCCYLRYMEVKRNPSVFDFARYSLSTGEIHPLLRARDKEGCINLRISEIRNEPGAALAVGILLFICQQPIGILIAICAILYGLGYSASYYVGSHFVMDKIDEMIMNEEMESVFVNDKDPSDARGVQFYMKRPNSKEARQKLADQYMVERDIHDDEDDDDDNDDGGVVTAA